MARKPKNLTIQKVNNSALTPLSYTVPTGTVTSASLVVTNQSTDITDVSIYINNTVDDFLLVTKKLAGGVGKSWRVLELSDEKLSAGYVVKVKSSKSQPINYFMSGSEITES